MHSHFGSNPNYIPDSHFGEEASSGNTLYGWVRGNYLNLYNAILELGLALGVGKCEI